MEFAFLHFALPNPSVNCVSEYISLNCMSQNWHAFRVCRYEILTCSIRRCEFWCTFYLCKPFFCCLTFGHIFCSSFSFLLESIRSNIFLKFLSVLWNSIFAKKKSCFFLSNSNFVVWNDDELVIKIQCFCWKCCSICIVYKYVKKKAIRNHRFKFKECVMLDSHWSWKKNAQKHQWKLQIWEIEKKLTFQKKSHRIDLCKCH